jgi:hypothetical protein
MTLRCDNSPLQVDRSTLRHDLRDRERPQQGTGCDSGLDRATVSTLQTLTTWMSEETESADHGLDYSDLSYPGIFGS